MKFLGKIVCVETNSDDFKIFNEFIGNAVKQYEDWYCARYGMVKDDVLEGPHSIFCIDLDNVSQSDLERVNEKISMFSDIIDEKRNVKSEVYRSCRAKKT